MTRTELSDRLPAPGSRLSELGLPAIGATAAFAYLVMVGGTDFGELLPPLQLINGMVAGVLILAFVSGLPRADRIDRLVLLALILFTGAALLSSFPRQSLDATLAALAYTAGFFVARDLLSRERVRKVFVRVLVLLSLVVTTLTAIGWLTDVLEWWRLVDGSVVPPLGFEHSAGAWGHRHDLALLVAMLYPSWWIARPSPMLRGFALFIGLLSAFIIVIDGSRVLWLALAVATVVAVGPRLMERWPRRSRFTWSIVAAGVAIAFALIATGVAAAFIDRALSLSSLEYRLAMWGSLTDAWLAHPVGGLGPGSFPWALQPTGYFDANSWAPRHPDSQLFQLLSEAGILGVLAVGCVAAAIVPKVMVGRSTAARWALIAFVVAGLGSNPTDFAFLVVLAIAWTAYAVPRHPVRPEDGTPRAAWPRYAALGALTVIAFAQASHLAGAAAYMTAADAVREERLRDAESSLSIAVGLDPGMALYARQRGTVRLLLEDVPAATADLERSVQMNPSDDQAWRTLSLARAASGDITSAIESAHKAVAVQRADPSNMLLGARLMLDDGRAKEASEQLGQVVRAWPEIVGTPEWHVLIKRGDLEAAGIIGAAAEHESGPTPRSNPLLLAAVAGTPVPPLSSVDMAKLASFRCDPDTARILRSATDADKRTAPYWEVAIRASAIAGIRHDNAVRLYELLSGDSVDAAAVDATLNPLHQADFPVPFGLDLWGYRRIPIGWPDYEFELPDPRAGAARWLLDPVAAGRASGVATCG